MGLALGTLQEIKTAIAGLNEHDKTVLAAELFAEQMPTPDEALLTASLDRGWQDMHAGRVRPIEDVRALVTAWTSKS